MKKIYMIGNTHFDPVWLWEWDEALSSITATFRSVLERMEEYADFTYSFSAPAVFEWIKNTDPDLFDRIKQRIAEGRWELCEGWWLQADCNCALGESYVRQGLYAQRYFEKNFGKRSQTVFNIDSFGHPATLPQILNGCGISNYVFWRPNEKQKHIDTPLFVWRGKNGSSVNAYRIGGDGGEIFKAEIEKDMLDPLIANAGNIPHDIMAVYGVTDHGGAPTKQMIEAILHKQKSFNIAFGRVDEFFRNADMSVLPVVDDELQVQFIGPYSNFTEIKKNNRRAEYAVMNAEKVSVIANKLLGREYRQTALTECWQDVMFNQFHDILGGCSIESAYTDARDLHGRAIRTANEITHFALQSITNKVKMPGKNPDNAWNIVVWNLNGFDITAPVEAEVQWAWEFDWYGGGIALVDEQCNEYPTQIITEKSVVPRFRSRFVFNATVPALGYKTFIVKQVADKGQTPSQNREITLDHDKNCVYDKDGKVLLTSLLKPYAVKDICDTWGFNKTVFEEQKHYLDLKECKVIEDGIIRKSYQFVWEFDRSTVRQVISLYRDRIDCRYRVLWNEEGYALKFELSNGNQSKIVASTPYGSVEREKCEYERPMGEWLSFGNGDSTVTIAADSIFAYGFDGENIGLTVLRNCIFGDLRTEPLDTDRDYRYMGQGVTDGSVSITFEGSADKEGTLKNNPLIVMCEANHDGVFNPQNGFLNCPEELVVTVLKKAEDSGEYVIRLYNPTDKTVEGNVTLFENASRIKCNAGEILTLVTKDKTFVKTDMLEQ